MRLPPLCISLLLLFTLSFLLFPPINHICSYYRREGWVTPLIGVLISRNDLTHTKTCMKIKQPTCLVLKYPRHLAQSKLDFPAFCTFPCNWIVHVISKCYLHKQSDTTQCLIIFCDHRHSSSPACLWGVDSIKPLMNFMFRGDQLMLGFVCPCIRRLKEVKLN